MFNMQIDKNKLTLCVPCYNRPQRTLRALDCVVNQDFNGWEAYFIGDNCPDYQKLLLDGSFEKYSEIAKANGNKIYFENLPEHSGGWGYEVRNRIFRLANSEYLLFMDNDDMIKPNHFTSYYNAINDSDNCDFVYLDTWLEPIGIKRISDLVYCMIGHHEIIVKTEFIKQMPPQLPHYGHDWTLIENMINAGAKHKKVITEPTYIVKGLGELRNDTID